MLSQSKPGIQSAIAPQARLSRSRYGLLALLNPRLLVQALFALILGLAAGYRSFGDGRDFANYEYFYNSIWSFDYLDAYRFEVGFVWIAAVFKLLFSNEIGFLIAVLATASLFVKFRVFSRYNMPLLTTIFYLCCWYPLHEYTQIRAAFAFALIFVAVEAFFRGKNVTFALLVGCAMLFHTSALVVGLVLPGAYYLSRFPLPFVLVGGAASALIMLVLLGPLLAFAAEINPFSLTYIENFERVEVNIFSGANLLTAVLLAAILLAGSLSDRRDTTFFILVIIGLGAAVAFRDFPVFSHRLREMFLIFLVPLAFNMRFTPQGALQFLAAVSLAGWYFVSHLSQGVIGAGL